MMAYKTALFDMDGTLLDTLADMVSAVNHILSVHGWPQRTTEEVRAFVGNGARRLMERAVPPDVTGGAFEAVLAEYREWYQAHNCVDTAPYPGIPALLDALAAAGVKTAVVSNKPDATTKALAARFFPGMLALGQREGVEPKPSPALVIQALAELGADAAEAVYVGDSEVDVATARNAGLPMIGVSWGFRGREGLAEAGAEVIVDTAGELLERLLQA